MRVKHCLMFVAAALAGFAVAGCQRESEGPALAVAVVDMNEVAERLGRDAKIQNALEAKQKELSDELNSVQKNLAEQLEKARSQAGEQPSDEASQRLAELSREARRRLTETRQKASEAFGRKRDELAQRFREEVKPYAREAARKRGMSLVIPYSDNNVLTMAPSVNITDDVVGLMVRDGKQASESGGSGGAGDAPSGSDGG